MQTRFTAVVVFSGDLHPRPDEVAVALARKDFNVPCCRTSTGPAWRTRSMISCMRRVAIDVVDERHQPAADAMWSEIEDIIRFDGSTLVLQCGIDDGTPVWADFKTTPEASAN